VRWAIAKSVPCCRCGRAIAPARPGLDRIKCRPVCLECLPELSGATFVERLRALRVAKDLSRHQLAEAAGLSPSAIRYYEGEGSIPRGAALAKLVAVLGPMLLG